MVCCLQPLMEILTDQKPLISVFTTFDGKAIQTTKFENLGPTKNDVEFPTL